MPRRLPTFFRQHESDALLRAAASDRDRLILLLGLFLGLRVSEICKLRIEHVDLVGKLCFVYQSKGKKDRYVPIPDRLIDPLKAWIGEKVDGWLFRSKRREGPIGSRGVQLMIKRIARDAGIPNWNKPRAVTPHKCRHAYASRLLETGADIMEIKDLLGHASVGTTQVYLQTTPERLRGAVNRI